MKKKGNLKFTGFLIIIAVIAYLVLIGNAMKPTHTQEKVKESETSAQPTLDSISKNPFANIYQKVGLEKKRKENMLLGK